ncbi:hypothetical protein [Glycomyces xiaoerkulensis]|uniref:hypothetical protein n=1 Tax=Glycomyces xiaoerkulensis TaxID=2038139 RepID=UPI000C25EFE6|nr:hypothetical protein [Glycomyces xiaoerkulensis]
MSAPSQTSATGDRGLGPAPRRRRSFAKDRLPVLLGVLAGLLVVGFVVWMTVRGQQLAAQMEDRAGADLLPFEQTAAFGMGEARFLLEPDAEATESFSADEVGAALERVLWVNQQGRNSFTLGRTGLDELLALYADDQRAEVEAAMGTVEALDYATVLEDDLGTGIRAEAVEFSYEEVEAGGAPVLEVHTTIFWAYGFAGDRDDDPMEHTVFLEHSADWRIDAADVEAGVWQVGSELTMANPDCAAARRGIVAALPYERWEDGEFGAGDCRG